LLAISRCFAGSIAAKPRFAPPLFVAAIGFPPFVLARFGNATFQQQFTMLMHVSELLLKAARGC
jgi:hypothetical protein